MVVVAEQVAQTVNREAGKFTRKPSLAAAANRGFDGNNDIAEQNAIACGIAFPIQLLLVKTEHIGGAIEFAVSVVEPAHLLVASEQHRDLGTRPV